MLKIMGLHGLAGMRNFTLCVPESTPNGLFPSQRCVICITGLCDRLPVVTCRKVT